MNREEITAHLLAALRPGPDPQYVKVETPDGGEALLLYGEGPDFADHGVALLPPALDFPHP